ncbi:MAG: RidA family protein [Bryobacteraceae bacterium]|nr:RidA family protein [Bryobacteraceae bacterium]
MTRKLVFLLTFTALAGLVLAQPKKKKGKKEPPEITQTLEVLPEPPNAIAADTARLSFAISPLSNKGLLSQQTRDALKAVRAAAHGGAIVKLRAFVAGNGDLRRIPSIVSEVLTEAHVSLPAVSTVFVGALPLEGAQVQIEATYLDKRPVNPAGVAFFAGQVVRATAEKPRPLAEVFGESLANLQTAVKAADAEMLKVTCYVSHLEGVPEIESRLNGAFPKAIHTLVQLQRVTGPSLTECEGVGRLATAPSKPVEFLNPEGLAKSPAYTQVVKVNAPKVVFTTTQQSFGLDAAGMRLMLDRLRKMLDGANASFEQVAMAHIYSLSGPATEAFRGVRGGYYNAQSPPASTLLVFEGLPSNDATLGVDLVAVPRL